MRALFKLPFIVLFLAWLAAGCAAGNAGQDAADQGAGKQTPKTTDLPPKQETSVQKHTVSLYFSDKELTKTYRTEKDVEVENEADLPKAALQAWIAGPEQEKLSGLVPPGVAVEYVKASDGTVEVSFSKEIKHANLGSTGEMMLLGQLALIMKQFGYDATQVLVEGKKEETLLGHMDTSKPLKAQDPGNIEFIK